MQHSCRVTRDREARPTQTFTRVSVRATGECMVPATRRSTSDGPEMAADVVFRAARTIGTVQRLPNTAPQHRIELDRIDLEPVPRAAETMGNSRRNSASAVAETEAQFVDGLEAIGERH